MPIRKENTFEALSQLPEPFSDFHIRESGGGVVAMLLW